MSFLYLEGQKVRCTEEGFTLKEVKKIWNNDKTGKEKSYFNDVITAIYFIYKPRGIFWQKSIPERVNLVDKDYIKNSSWEDLLKRDGVIELIKVYQDLTLTINERMMENVKKDATQFIDILYGIPMLIKKTITKNEEILDDETNKFVKVKVDHVVDFPNMKNKQEAYELAVSITKNIKQIEENLKIEEIDREKEAVSKRMFDGRDENKSTIPDVIE